MDKLRSRDEFSYMETWIHGAWSLLSRQAPQQSLQRSWSHLNPMLLPRIACANVQLYLRKVHSSGGPIILVCSWQACICRYASDVPPIFDLMTKLHNFMMVECVLRSHVDMSPKPIHVSPAAQWRKRRK